MSLYDQDFYLWTLQQAEWLKAGALSLRNIENLIEEVESMGKSQKKEFTSLLTVFLSAHSLLFTSLKMGKKQCHLTNTF